MVKIYHKVIDQEVYSKDSIENLNKIIESINSLKARTPKETLELKLQSIRKLPRLVSHDSIRYKLHYSSKTAEVWYEEI